jgi:hypothetical protein
MPNAVSSLGNRLMHKAITVQHNSGKLKESGLLACSDVVGYQRFGVPCCLHLQGEVSEAWIKVQVMVFWFVTPCSDVV